MAQTLSDLQNTYSQNNLGQFTTYQGDNGANYLKIPGVDTSGHSYVSVDQPTLNQLDQSKLVNGGPLNSIGLGGISQRAFSDPITGSFANGAPTGDTNLGTYFNRVTNLTQQNKQVADANATNQANGDYVNPQNIPSRFEQGFNNATGGDQGRVPLPPVPLAGEAPQQPVTQTFGDVTGGGVTSSEGRTAVDKYVQPEGGNPQADVVIQANQAHQQYLNDFATSQTSQKQNETLTQEYTRLTQEAGIPALNTQLLNMKNVMNGSEDDIRNEISKSGGFATNSQVLALTDARNKTMIQNYNNLLQTRDDMQKNLTTMIGLSEKDRAYASAQIDKQLNFDLQQQTYADKMLTNAQDSLTNSAKTMGWNGIMEAALATGDPQAIARINSTMGNGFNIEQAAQKEKDVKAQADFKASLENQKTQSEINKTQSEIANTTADNARAQATLDETIRKNKADEAIANAKNISEAQNIKDDNKRADAIAAETARHNKADEAINQTKANIGAGVGGGPPLPQVNMTASGKPDSVGQSAFLNALPGGANGAIATDIKALANYDLNPNTFSVRQYKGVGAVTRADMVTKAMQYDPSYKESDFAMRQAYKQNVASGQIYQGIVAANKSINHLVAFTNAVTDINNSFLYGRGISATFNAAQTAIKQPFSQSLQTQVKTATTEASGLKDELAKFFKGTGTTDVQSINDWTKNLNVNATPGDLKGTVQGAITLMAGQLDVLNQQYQQTMGRAPGDIFIQPATAQKLSQLKNQGYTVDIPGIHYTDVNAYMKFGGGNQQSLNQARQTLTNLNDPNNPATPENILELAQIQ